MCGSEEDRKIFVFGGFDGDRHLMDVCVLELDRLTWSCPSTTGTQPPPREGHAASMVGKYLFIAGGNDGHRQLADVYALDTESMIWECIMDGSDNGLGGDPSGANMGNGGMSSMSGGVGAADMVHMVVRLAPPKNFALVVVRIYLSHGFHQPYV
jgi:hypothetical protein